MTWQFQHKDKLGQYRRYEELTGEQAEEAAAAPKLHKWNISIWSAFNLLTGSRQWTMGGPAAIPFSELKAWMEWENMDGDAAADFLYLIMELDSTYLELSAKKD